MDTISYSRKPGYGRSPATLAWNGRAELPVRPAFRALVAGLILGCCLNGAAAAQPAPPPRGGLPGPPPPAEAYRAAPSLNTLENLRAEALAAGLSEVQARILIDRIDRLATGRLPWRPVIDRTRQGLAKGASFERIEAVCATLEARLRSGALLVDGAFAASGPSRPGAPESPGGGARPGGADSPDSPRPGGDAARIALIDHTTFALEQGVPAQSLSTLFSTLGRETPFNPAAGTAGAPISPHPLAALTSPVVALTTLSSEGVPSPRGVEVVTAAWRNGMRDGQMEDLGLGLALALRSGRPPEEIMNRVVDMCRRGVPPEKILGDFPRPGPRFQGPNRPGRGSAPAWMPGRSGGPGDRPGRRPGDRPPDDPGKRGRPRRGGGTGGTGGRF